MSDLYFTNRMAAMVILLTSQSRTFKLSYITYINSKTLLQCIVMYIMIESILFSNIIYLSVDIDVIHVIYVMA